ncbi:extracellular solute-binding protein [Gayadomonas joobiniege]|uniref:extracellular solute-binding protein n=1 Tax=Gayadomonas joobiniege TaxID=1234606 RepID=UPI00036EF533|nr:extracellular solute-binding protein [Gayadomonas joobiniege]
MFKSLFSLTICLPLIFLFTLQKASAETVVLSGWGGFDRLVIQKILSDVVATELTQANIQVAYTALESSHNSFLLNRFSSGKAPDVFYVDVSDIHRLAKLDLLYNFSYGAPELVNRIYPELNQLFTIRGETFGIVKDYNTISMQFNKDLFRAAKVPFLTDSETFASLEDKLAKLAAHLKPKGQISICLTPDYASFAPFALSAGWQPFTENGQTQLDENFITAFRFYVGLVRKGIAAVPNNVGHTWSSGCLTSGLSAVSVEGTWINQHIQIHAPNLNFATVAPPVSSAEKKPGNLIFAVAWAVNRNSAQLDKSLQLIQILTSQKVQHFIWNNAVALPASNQVIMKAKAGNTASENQLFQSTARILATSQLYPYQFERYGSAWMAPINKALRSAMLSNRPLEQLIQEAQKAYLAMYKEVYVDAQP